MFVKMFFMLITAVLVLPFYSDAGIMLDRVVAIVNKEVITWSDLYRSMEFEAPEAVKAMKPEEKRKFFKDNEHQYLENLIDARLQLQEARRSGIGISESDIDRAIEDIKSKYALTEEQFREAVEKEGMPFSDYRKKLGEQIIIGRVIEQDIRTKIVVTEKEIDEFIGSNKDAAELSEGYDISHIFFAKSSSTEQKAKDAYEKLRNGANFMELAYNVSEDASAKAAGHLGFINKSELSSDFARVVAEMNKGEISKPFWSENGMHILKVNDKVVIKSDQDMRDVAKRKLLENKFSKEYKDWTRSLRESAYIEVKE
ncbi:MAG: peptidylprolyl isomerase [Dissulfurispiraceae bacterium]|nr:peptidylprolyl isomerase [Dissulfurispiraceae bacterium]